MPYASLDDYLSRSRETLDALGTAQVLARLDDASAVIDAALPTGYAPPLGIARTVCVTAAIRAVRNPGGYRSRAIGEYSESVGEAGGVYLTEAERADLLSALDTPTAYTLDTTGW